MSASDYPKRARLRSRPQFLRVLGTGRIHPGRECVVRIAANDVGFARLGLATPRQYGNAVRRNRFRRLVRAAFRELKGELGGVDVFVVPRRGVSEPTFAGLSADLAAAPTQAREQRPRATKRRR